MVSGDPPALTIAMFSGLLTLSRVTIIVIPTNIPARACWINTVKAAGAVHLVLGLTVTGLYHCNIQMAIGEFPNPLTNATAVTRMVTTAEPVVKAVTVSDPT